MIHVTKLWGVSALRAGTRHLYQANRAWLGARALKPWVAAAGCQQMHDKAAANTKYDAGNEDVFGAVAGLTAFVGVLGLAHAESSATASGKHPTAGEARPEIAAAASAPAHIEAEQARLAAASTGHAKEDAAHEHEHDPHVMGNPEDDYDESHRRHWYSPLGRHFVHSQVAGQEHPYRVSSPDDEVDAAGLPILPAPKSRAPRVPPPCNRDYPAHLVLDLTTTSLTQPVSLMHKYHFWTYDGAVPGPMVRARVGDVLEVRYKNEDADGIGHNIDLHAVVGPGGGSSITFCEVGDAKVCTFKLLYPGLFIYHCAAAPVPVHIANGMYGMVLVEPEGGLPPVDKEFYVVQSEIYGEESEETPDLLDPSYSSGLDEKPMYVVFNGASNALTEKGPLQADQGDRIRIYFGNAGPNLVSSFHIIGCMMDKVYREGDMISPPARNLQTTLVPAGGVTVVEVDLLVPGNYTLIDHSIFRIDKGAIGFLKVRPRGGDRRRDVYDSVDPATPCPGCKLHN